MEVYPQVNYQNVDASAGATYVVELEVPFEHMEKVYVDFKNACNIIGWGFKWQGEPASDLGFLR